MWFYTSNPSCAHTASGAVTGRHPCHDNTAEQGLRPDQSRPFPTAPQAQGSHACACAKACGMPPTCVGCYQGPSCCANRCKDGAAAALQRYSYVCGVHPRGPLPAAAATGAAGCCRMGANMRWRLQDQGPVVLDTGQWQSWPQGWPVWLNCNTARAATHP
jgi:hypothetical protein